MQSQPPDRFQPLSLEEELDLLRDDDASFSRTQLYLAPLVTQALNTAKVLETEQRSLRAKILSQTSQAAERFLSNHGGGESYTFAAYFTWYIHQAVG